MNFLNNGNNFPSVGTYHKIVLYFDDVVLDEWKESDDEFNQSLFDAFWDVFNQVEAFDLESEVITKRIKELYFQSLNTQKAVHLNVIRAYKNHPVGQLTGFFGCFY